jgi:hypothetical protein
LILIEYVSIVTQDVNIVNCSHTILIKEEKREIPGMETGCPRLRFPLAFPSGYQVFHGDSQGLGDFDSGFSRGEGQSPQTVSSVPNTQDEEQE